MLERRLEGKVAAQTSRTAAKAIAITRTFAHKSKVFASNYCNEVDAEKWHVYFQGRSYERFLCLKKELNSK